MATKICRRTRANAAIFREIGRRSRRFSKKIRPTVQCLLTLQAKCAILSKNRKRAKVRPDEIRAFKREVRANCPAAPAAVSAAHADHCSPREGRRARNRCCKPEDLPRAPRSAFPRGCGNADLTPKACGRVSFRDAPSAAHRRFFRASCPCGRRFSFSKIHGTRRIS